MQQDKMKIEFAPNNLAEQYNSEIQEIFASLRLADGHELRRGIWALDESYISDIYPSNEALKKASKELGITLAHHMRFVDVAMELKNNRSKENS